jgi:hypothetical protein
MMNRRGTFEKESLFFHRNRQNSGTSYLIGTSYLTNAKGSKMSLFVDVIGEKIYSQYKGATALSLRAEEGKVHEPS